MKLCLILSYLLKKQKMTLAKKINSKISKADKNIQELQKDIISDIVNSADEIIIEIVKKFTNINHDKANLKQVVKVASKNILTEK